MRVVFTHHIADRTGRFAIGLVMRVTGLVHGVQNPPMHGFQAIAQIGDRAGNDDRHGIVQIGRAHLGFDGDRRAVIDRALGRGFIHVFRCFWRIAHVNCSFLVQTLYFVVLLYQTQHIRCKQATNPRVKIQSNTRVTSCYPNVRWFCCYHRETLNEMKTNQKPRRSECSKAKPN